MGARSAANAGHDLAGPMGAAINILTDRNNHSAITNEHTSP